MRQHFSRRSMMTKLGAATAGVLLKRRFSYAELQAPPGGTGDAARASEGRGGNGSYHHCGHGFDAADFGCQRWMKVLDLYYDDGSVAPRRFGKPDAGAADRCRRAGDCLG